VDHRFDTPRELAEVIEAQRRLGLGTGMIIANPIPEADALPEGEMEDIIAQACREADAAGIPARI
jgi:pseudouridine-5'-phosphate glycosidase